MPKRTHEEKMEYYLAKLDKLKERHKRRRHSFSYDNYDENLDNLQGYESIDVQLESTVPPEADARPSDLVPPLEQAAQPEPVRNTDDLTFPPLDPEMLSALGESTDAGPAWGQAIHESLTILWQPLLKKGMDKETKEKYLKKYLIPTNCTLLQAPKLNIEISAAIAEMVRMRDKKVEGCQQQLGAGITAISRALTEMGTGGDKNKVVAMLSDGCRILCDLHYLESQARLKMIMPGLAKPFLNIIQDSERDETLFGTNLPEKIKASKTIEKQGLQIRKTTIRPNLTSVTNMTAPRQQFQGNWTGPPRYPVNRGGRGGHRRPPMMPRRAPPPGTSAQSRPNVTKQRVQTRP